MLVIPIATKRAEPLDRAAGGVRGGAFRWPSGFGIPTSSLIASHRGRADDVAHAKARVMHHNRQSGSQEIAGHSAQRVLG